MLEELLIAGLILIATIVILKRNLAKKQTKEAVWAVLILWAAGCLQAAISLHLPISLPTDWIENVTAPIYVPILAWIKGG
ncbi:hypothetical protein ACX1C1_05640 [Paenibacillus sp. strain BS8-2]